MTTFGGSRSHDGIRVTDDLIFYLWLGKADLKNVAYRVVYERDEFLIRARDGTEVVHVGDSVGRQLWPSRHKWMTGMEMYFLLCGGT